MILTTLIGGNRESRTLTDGTYMIGRNPSCPICFDFPDVSERHAILTVRDGRAVVEDLHSANGTYVNGEPIDGAVVLDGGMVVQIGESMMRVCDENDCASGDAEDAAQDEPAAGGSASAAQNVEEDEPPPPDPMRELRRNVQEQIQKELLKRMDMKRLTMQGVDREGLEDTAREKIRQIIDEVVANGRLPDGIDPVRLEDDVFNEAMRLGPLEDLLADDTVSEIMVNGPDKVYIERGGKLLLSDCQFTDDSSVLSVIERIIAPLGRRCDESQPYVDARREPRQRDHRAARAFWPHDHDTKVRQEGALARGLHPLRNVDAQRRRVHEALRVAQEKRHRRWRNGLGQDDASQSSFGLHPPQRANRNSRGRCGTSPPAAARRAP